MCSRSYPAEIFPMRVRAKAVSITTTGNWITNTVFNTLTPNLISHAGANGAFCFFGALAAPTNPLYPYCIADIWQLSCAETDGE